MGAWETGPFANDTALDWVDDLVDADDFSIVTQTFEKALESSYMETGAGEEACAALAVLVLLCEPETEIICGVPENLQAWVEENCFLDGVIPDEIHESAMKVIQMLLSPDSELLKLWQDAELDDEWAGHIRSIRDFLEN